MHLVALHHTEMDGERAAMPQFLELKSELVLLGSGCNVDLTEDQADTLCTRVRATSDSLASYVPPSVTRSPPDGIGE
jgi:hypothetical protein